MDASPVQIEFRWRSVLEHALDLADRSAAATTGAERERYLVEALQTYQMARCLRVAEARR